MTAARSDAPTTPDQLRVVYIAGAKHCGSTLLDTMLGSTPGARSLGEAAGFFRYRPDQACACGEPPRDCTACVSALRSVEARAAPGDFERASRMPLKERRAHWLVMGTKARRRYAALADVVLESAAATSGCRVLIDSSKNASRAAALAAASRCDVRVVHVVRDGRGYLRSRQSRAEAEGTRHVVPLEMLSWLFKNLLIGSLLARRLPPGRYIICRYEDLISDPRRTLARICAFAGLDGTGLVDAATTGRGVRRGHLYEPARRVDYRWVRLDPTRLRTQRETPVRNALFWVLGGFVSSRWGYDRVQSYLPDAAPGEH